MKRGVVLILGIFLLMGVFGVVSALLSSDPTISNPSEGADYDSKITNFSWSTSDTLNLTTDKCWYQLNGGAEVPLVNCDRVITGISSQEGNNTWTVILNDSTTRKEKSVHFWVDSIIPGIILVNPTSQLSYTNQTSFTVSAKINETNWADATSPITFNVWDTHNHQNVNYPVVDLLTNISSQIYNSIYDNDGNYRYNLTSLDTIGHEGWINGTIIIDTKAPSSVSDDFAYDGIWINVDPIVSLTATDALSGINYIKNCSGVGCDISTGTIYVLPMTYSVEGDFVINYGAWDKAGNSNLTGTFNVKLDKTKPSTTDDIVAGWHNADVTVTLSPSDVLSGVNYTSYKVNSESWNNGTSVVVSSEGTNTINYYSVDNAGNVEATMSKNVQIDKSAPVTSDNAPAGWNTGFTVTLTPFDGYSGVASTLYCVDQTNSCAPGTSGTSVIVSTEGTNYVRYYSTDNVGNTETIKSAIVNVDLTRPTIAINGASPIVLEANVDAYTELDSTYSDGLLSGINASSYSITNPVNTNLTGTYIVNYSVKDNAGNLNSTTRTVNVVDTTAPIITLVGSDPVNVELGSVYTDAGATAFDIYDGDKTSNIVTVNPVNVNVVGTYIVTYDVSDLNGNAATQVTRTVNVVDTTAPTLSLLNPVDKRGIAFTTSINLEFDYTDYSNVGTCSLLIDGVINQSNNNYNNFSVNSLNTGAHYWKIVCNDSYNNIGNSVERNFTLLENETEALEFGEYTDLTQVDIANVTNFFVNNSFGMINYTSEIDFSDGAAWSSHINISQERIEVDSTGLPKLNKGAILRFYNLTFVKPEVLKDGISFCVSTGCTGYSYSNGILQITVTGFSVYTVREYVAPVAPSSSGGSSGGGGGGASSITCTTSWTCTEWSACSDGTQTRSCTKLNALCSAGAQPSESQTCGATNNEENSNGEVAGNAESSTGGISGITGNIIGLATSGNGMIALAFIGVVLAGIAIVVYRRKYGLKRF